MSCKYIFTEEEVNTLIDNYAVAVWEARDEHERALAGYVLACILEYAINNKRHEQKAMAGTLEDLRRQVKGMSFLE